MLGILELAAGLFGLEMSTLKQRLQRQAIAWMLLAVLGLIALVCILVAIHAALSLALGPVVAPLVMAGGALLIGVVIFLVFSLIENAERQKLQTTRHNAELTALLTSAALAAVPLLLPTIRKVGLPAGGAAVALFSLLQTRAMKRGQ